MFKEKRDIKKPKHEDYCSLKCKYASTVNEPGSLWCEKLDRRCKRGTKCEYTGDENGKT